MDNSTFQFPADVRYQRGPNPYEPLKEEIEVGEIPSSRPKGAAITSTVVNVTSYGPQPQDHLIWSIFNTIHFNFCCLGFMALVYSIKARDRKVMGDVNGASNYGSNAKRLNIAVLVLTVLFFIIIIILLANDVIGVEKREPQLKINPNLFEEGRGSNMAPGSSAL